MKRLAVLILITVTYTTASWAQKKDISINFGLQGNLPEKLFNSSIPDHNNKNGGLGIHLFPKYNYTKNISFGINMEYVFVIEDYQTDAIGGFDILSFTPTVDYYFTDNKIRPFIGFGAGLYHVLDHTPKFNLGIKPLVGISVYNFFDLSLEYNHILSDIDVNPRVHGEFDNYYLCVKGSFSIGVFNSGRNKKI